MNKKLNRITIYLLCIILLFSGCKKKMNPMQEMIYEYNSLFIEVFGILNNKDVSFSERMEYFSDKEIQTKIIKIYNYDDKLNQFDSEKYKSESKDFSDIILSNKKKVIKYFKYVEKYVSENGSNLEYYTEEEKYVYGMNELHLQIAVNLCETLIEEYNQYFNIK